MPLADIRRLEAVTERDIDLLLLEEFTVNPAFVRWFAGKASPAVVMEEDGTRAWHSLSDAEMGESDLVLVFRSAGADHAVMIENKVDAAPQPAQSARYRLRGIAGMEAGSWASFSACLVAPAKYLTAERHTAGYDALISYEDIAAWLREGIADRPRSDFKIFPLSEAIEQNRRGYVARPDAQVTRFFTEYWEFAESVFPELKFSHVPSRPVGSTWAEFHPAQIPKGRLILHKVVEGFVDLQIAGLGARTDELNTLNAALLENGVRFVRTGKSASLRAEVAPMNHRGDFAPQRDAALAALKAAFRLVNLEKLILVQ